MAAPYKVGQRVIVIRPLFVTRGEEWLMTERLGQRATVLKVNYDMVSSTPPSAPLVIGRVGKCRRYRSVSVEFDNGDRLSIWLRFVQDAADYDAAQAPAPVVAEQAAAPAADARPDDALTAAAIELDDWLARALQLARRTRERVYVVRLRPNDDARLPYEYALQLAGDVAAYRAAGWLFYCVMADVRPDVAADADGMASCRDCGAPLGFRVGQPVFASIDRCADCLEAVLTGAGRTAPAAASC